MLHDISIYRIDIECELNINYEYLLKPTSNDIENRYQAQISPKSVNTLSDNELYSAEIHERNVILVTLEGYFGFEFLECSLLNQLYRNSNRTQNTDIVQH